jgi:hypothetical protein
MSIKSRVLAIAATLIMVSGVALAGAVSATAATPSCGGFCIDGYSQQFGKAYITDVFQRKIATGQPVILFQRSNSDPAEDFTVSMQGTVSDFFAAGLVSAQVMLHYGCKPGFVFTVVNGTGQGGTLTCPANDTFDEPAGEIQYAPFGVDSGLCIGVATKALPAVGRAPVSLQPCGTDSGTVWILDGVDVCQNFAFNEAPLINGADTNFSLPSVLTYPSASVPTDKPRPQLKVTNLTGFSQNGPPTVQPSGCQSIVAADSSQLWSAYLGIAK